MGFRFRRKHPFFNRDKDLPQIPDTRWDPVVPEKQKVRSAINTIDRMLQEDPPSTSGEKPAKSK